MWTAKQVIGALRESGELWEPVRGLVSLRGDALVLFDRIDGMVREIARAEGFPEWRLAPGLELETLDRAQYFQSFPQWLTAAAHLSDDPAKLEAVARSDQPARAAEGAMLPAQCALSPALCYHTYAHLAGETVDTARMSARGTCWRHEGERLRPLERGWAFTMHELVVLGSPFEVESLRVLGTQLASTLASTLGIGHEIVAASDPFFAPTARGKRLLQSVKGLKRELVLPIGEGRVIAAASFNNHEHFFGERFDIRLQDGTPASSACVAFGIERWLLAFLVAHGPDARAWPDFDLELSHSRRIGS